MKKKENKLGWNRWDSLAVILGIVLFIIFLKVMK